MKKTVILPLVLAAFVSFSACSSGSSAESSQVEPEASAGSVSTVNSSEMFTDRDMEIGYDEETSIRISLSGDSAVSDSDAVEISGGTITIKEEGTYILSGMLSEGMILISADDTDNVQLVLDDAEITNSSSAAIYVLEADKVFITTSSGSQNTLANGGEYVAIDDSNIDAVVFSKADLTLNGAGTLRDKQNTENCIKRRVVPLPGHDFLFRRQLLFYEKSPRGSCYAISGKFILFIEKRK